MTAVTEDFATRPLGERDSEAGCALSSEAGWNQTVQDWRQMIAAGEAFGQFAGGHLVGSTVVLPYEQRLAWIAMVLTSEAYRGRGLASSNLGRAVERCRERGWTAGLDATPAGREVYEPLGFRPVFGLHRFTLDRLNRPPPRRRDLAIRPLVTVVEMDAVAALDARVFGVERRTLLGYLRRRLPERALLAEARGRLAGFVFARPGRVTLHLGPLAADGPEAARTLVVQALSGVAGNVSIDVPDHQVAFIEILGQLGFACERPFERMILSDEPAPGEPDRCFAIAGPEFG